MLKPPIEGSAQLFPPSFDQWLGMFVLAGLVGVIVGIGALWTFAHSDYVQQTRFRDVQPIQFSHRHHVSEVGLDCRYCHNGVERSATAGVPASSVCLTCHSQLYADSDELAPLRDSYNHNEPLHWKRVYRLPDYVFFNHSIHVTKGVSCKECHGRVDQMALVSRQQPMTMQFCLDCHRNPGHRLSPPEKVFDMTYERPDSSKLDKELVQHYHIRTVGLTDCVVCHR